MTHMHDSGEHMIEDSVSSPRFLDAPPLPIRFVLLHPHTPENLGAAARALKNFGFSDWAVVSLDSDMDMDRARRLAVHAEDLVDGLRRVDTLDEAVLDCAFVTGTSSRHAQGREFLRPEEWAAKAAALCGAHGWSVQANDSPSTSPTPVAIVFGEERSGMSNEEIQRCHALSGIPTLPEQPSLNLAQAILLYAYEARKASIQVHQSARPPSPQPVLATDEALGRIESLVRQVLTQSGFLSSKGERAAVRDLMSPLLRAAPCLREGRLLEAALHTVLKALNGNEVR